LNGHTVVHGADPVRLRQRRALAVRDRDERHIAELVVERRELRQVETAVHRRHGLARERAKQREVHVLEVEVQDVELVRATAHLLEHQRDRGERVADRGIEAQRAPRARDEIRRGLRLAAREERDVVAEPHQLFGEVGHHALRAAVQPRRDALRKRGDLGDLHCNP
jgi:hypothetical protein